MEGWIAGIVVGFLVGLNDGATEGWVDGITGTRCKRKKMHMWFHQWENSKNTKNMYIYTHLKADRNICWTHIGLSDFVADEEIKYQFKH